MSRASGGPPVTEQDLMMGSCSRCFQRECSRSLFGRSRFEQRTSAWRERLFEHVPRMDDSDPRLITLTSKRFIEIDNSRIPEIGSGSTWIDPRELDVPEESSQASGPVEPAPEPTLEPSVVEETPAATPVAPALSPTLVSNHPLQPRLLNTPRQQPQMIGNRPAPPPKRDAWEVAPQETKGLPVVRPGARIKMGSGV